MQIYRPEKLAKASPDTTVEAAGLFAREIYNRHGVDEIVSRETLRIRKSDYFIVALQEEAVAGAIAGKLWPEEEILDIQSLASDRKFRGQRIGAKLIKSLVATHDLETKKPTDLVRVYIREDGRGQTEFYEKCGFTSTDVDNRRLADLGGRYASCADILHSIETFLRSPAK